MNENSDQPSASRGNPNSRSTLANPNPCTRPNVNADPRTQIAAVTSHEIVGSHEHDAQRDRRLDDARRRREDVQRGQRQRDAVPDRERGDDADEGHPAAAEQQQTDEKQDVIRPDQDVMRPRRNERLHHRNRALRRPEVVGVRLGAGVEDHLLPQIGVLVDVDEGLVDRVVRKEVRIDGQ